MRRDQKRACRMLPEQTQGRKLALLELSALQRALHAEGDDEVRERRHELRGEGADAPSAQELLAQRIAPHLVIGKEFGLAADAGLQLARENPQDPGVVLPPLALIFDIGLLQRRRDDETGRILR